MYLQNSLLTDNAKRVHSNKKCNS